MTYLPNAVIQSGVTAADTGTGATLPMQCSFLLPLADSKQTMDQAQAAGQLIPLITAEKEFIHSICTYLLDKEDYCPSSSVAAGPRVLIRHLRGTASLDANEHPREALPSHQLGFTELSPGACCSLERLFDEAGRLWLQQSCLEALRKSCSLLIRSSSVSVVSTPDQCESAVLGTAERPPGLGEDPSFTSFTSTKQKRAVRKLLKACFTKNPCTALIEMCMVLGIWSQIQVRQMFRFVTIQWNLHQACSTELGTSEASHSETNHTFSHVLIATFTPALFGFH